MKISSKVVLYTHESILCMIIGIYKNNYKHTILESTHQTHIVSSNKKKQENLDDCV